MHTKSAKEDVEGIKKDIESLVNRLGSIKDKSGDIMSEQFENLSTVMSSFKNKGVEKGQDALTDICASTRDHPVRNLAYAFAAGILLAFFIK
ncbi:hypothetical protein [Candidatus Tisiphia endosymbiont of Beris chalybata]|uniref:hypothetical protein n=1 Tax=Candidatus Tisiphia endosymbiont of Beris chalybata TaxID=3066262 RepID=UPI00312CA82A